MKEWPILYVGVIAAALCCLLAPLIVLLIGAASLSGLLGEAVIPLLIGLAVLAVIAFWVLRRRRRGRRLTTDRHSARGV